MGVSLQTDTRRASYKCSVESGPTSRAGLRDGGKVIAGLGGAVDEFALRAGWSASKSATLGAGTVNSISSGASSLPKEGEGEADEDVGREDVTAESIACYSMATDGGYGKRQ